MKERFQSINFQGTTLYTIRQAEAIIDKYAKQGFTLTLRQLYYQFVARDLIPNSERSYNRLGDVITKARIAGRIDWNAIEDRGRGIQEWLIQESEREACSGLTERFGLDMWYRQDVYVEVWVEKDALSSVVRRACRRWRVPYMPCKGYLSASEAYRSGKRFQRSCASQKVIIHLGDHDPSGIDMTRDNRDRTHMFSHDPDIEVRRIALNMDQIEEYNPPPNFAKESDSRFKQYKKLYGEDSWELDALEPTVIDKLIDDEIRTLVDFDQWEEDSAEEEEREQVLQEIYDRFDEVKDYLEGTLP